MAREGTVISPYGIRFLGMRPDLHRGVDIRVPDGTEVLAMADGKVRFAGTMSGYGNVVWLDHPGDVISVYAHLSSILVTRGQAVEGRQKIALSGHSGNASGPHLHFESIGATAEKWIRSPSWGDFPGDEAGKPT